MISLRELIESIQFATAVDVNSLISKGIIAVIIGATVIEVIPKIKLKPWTWVLGFIGKKLNKETLDKMKSMEKELGAMKSELDSIKKDVNDRFDKTDAVIEQNEVKNCRVRILRFADELSHGTPKHSKEHFDQTMRDIDQYESYCGSHKDFENNVTEISIKLIKKSYYDRREKNDWE